ncbi:MAG: hypothetical protein NTY22_02150 [Proteobacteria bacterium]|nr:hypothetical protein [Pseudomonadota bacterium]
MRALILFICLVFSCNSFSECYLDAEIKDLKKKLADYQKAKDHAWDRYKANCMYIGVNVCWYCNMENGFDYRMITYGNTIPVSVCSKITCIFDPTTLIGAVEACLGISIPIVDYLQSSCRYWCNDWHAQDDAVIKTAQLIAADEETKKTACPDTTDPCITDPNSAQCICTTAGLIWSTAENLCCDKSPNSERCICIANGNTYDDATATCSPTGSGPPDPKPDPDPTDTTTTKTDPTYVGSLPNKKSTPSDTSTTPTTTNSSQTPSGTGGINVNLPGGTSGNEDKSWYDGTVALYKPGNSSSANYSMKSPSDRSDGAITNTGSGSGKTTKKSNGINQSDTSIFTIVTNMYQKRYYAGLIGENIKTGVIKANIKVGKKPIIYK